MGLSLNFKKIYRRGLYGALAATFVAVAFEWDGGEIGGLDKDRKIAQMIDKSCRPMTQGEIAMARIIYGDLINYDEVRIFNRRHMMTLGRSMAPNGNIYFGAKEHRSDDFSKEDLDKQCALIHELMHVVQEKKYGMSMRTAAWNAYKKSGFDYARAYVLPTDWQIATGKSMAESTTDLFGMNACNFEQQAEMPEHYFKIRRKFEIFLERIEKGDTTRFAFRSLYGDVENADTLDVSKYLALQEKRIIQMEKALSPRLPIQPMTARLNSPGVTPVLTQLNP